MNDFDGWGGYEKRGQDGFEPLEEKWNPYSVTGGSKTNESRRNLCRIINYLTLNLIRDPDSESAPEFSDGKIKLKER